MSSSSSCSRCCPLPCSLFCPFSYSVLSEFRPLLVSTQPQGSILLFPFLLGSGKLAGLQEVHAFPAGDSNLVFLQDSLSGCKFLVNTVASISVFPQAAPTPPSQTDIFSPPFLIFLRGSLVQCFSLNLITRKDIFRFL